MSTQSNPKIDYAKSHDVVRLSTKRYEQSPYAAKYATDDTVYGLYANRFYPLSLDGDPLSDYWQLRQKAMLYDVPEKPLQIEGPDAVTLLEKVFCRRISKLKPMRARYAIACTPNGKILMDGVLIRFSEDHFWYVQADGEFETWLLAHSGGLDVQISDPKSWVLQIQGPNSLEILNAAIDEDLPDNFGYFHAGLFHFAGEELLVTRTGWTGEIGFEIYSKPSINHLALWDHLIAAGKPFGMRAGSLASMGTRRIEAGILDNGTDMDVKMTPYEAGLGMFIDLSKPDFVGKSALEKADQRCLLFGLICNTAVSSADLKLFQNEKEVGFLTAGVYSPTLDKGIGYARFFAPHPTAESWLGQTVMLQDKRNEHHSCKIVSLPFYDAEKKIPRGLS